MPGLESNEHTLGIKCIKVAREECPMFFLPDCYISGDW